MEEIKLRPVRADDEPFLLNLYTDSRKEERKYTTWNDEEWAEFMLLQFVAQNKDYQARYPDAKYDIIMFGDVAAGRLWVAEDDDEVIRQTLQQVSSIKGQSDTFESPEEER